MSYHVEGRGDGKLHPNMSFKALDHALRNTPFEVEDLEDGDVNIHFNGRWFPEETRQILLSFLVEARISFEGEEQAFWVWEVEKGRLLEQQLQLCPLGAPVIYPAE